MSFFDDADEPSTETRTSSRRSTGRPRRRGGSGYDGGLRPPSAQQQIVMRRAIAIVVLIVVIVLIAVGVSSCQSSADKSALENYTQRVNSLIDRSQQTSGSLFGVLTSGAGSGDAQSVQHQISQTASSAQSILTAAQRQSVPSAVKAAQANLVQALQLRYDGITDIADNIEQALSTSVTKQAIDAIAADMARFYASDVLYKQYAAADLAAALHRNGVAVGGAGETIDPAQFLKSIQWLSPSYIAGALGANLPGGGASSRSPGPGPHGHELNSVSYDGSTLSTSGNTVSVKSPTFTLQFTNSGASEERDVRCRASVTGGSSSGSKVVPETFAGKPATCVVTLSPPPAAGTYTVVFTIEKVPGETALANNTLSFPVTFQ